MLEFLKDRIRSICKDEVAETFGSMWHDVLGESVTVLDPEKLYIMVVPTENSERELIDAFEPFKGKANLLVLRADNVRLLELS